MSVSAQTSAVAQDEPLVQPPMPAPNPAGKATLELLPWLQCNVTLEIPVPRFKVNDLLKLGKGSILVTDCDLSSDIPLRANQQLVGWTEFEIVGERLAVRITELP